MRLDEGNREVRQAMSIEQQIAYVLVLIRTYLFDKHVSIIVNDMTSLHAKYHRRLIYSKLPLQEEEFDFKNRIVEFYADCLEYSKIIGEAVPRIEDFLVSKTNTDVIEAVDFFTTGYMFQVKNTTHGMRRMLSLVWTEDKEKRAAVTKAYHRVLFETDVAGRGHSLKVVSNLFAFLEEITSGEYFALETLIKEWVEDNTIDANIIQVFFERFTLKLPSTTDNMARISLQFLIMVSQ